MNLAARALASPYIYLRSNFLFKHARVLFRRSYTYLVKMRSPYMLTLLLVAASSVTCRHILSRSDSKYSLVARGPTEGRPGRPAEARPQLLRPVAYVKGGGETELPEDKYHETLAKGPGYDLIEARRYDPQQEAAKIQGARDSNGKEQLYFELPGEGWKSTVHELQALNRVPGVDGVRFNGPKVPSVSELEAHSANTAALEAAKSEPDRDEERAQLRHSFASQPPLNQIGKSYRPLSQQEALVNLEGRSPFRHLFDREEGFPFPIAFFGEIPDSYPVPPSIQLEEARDESPYVDKEGNVMGIPDLHRGAWNRLRRRESVLTQIEDDVNSPNITLSGKSAQFQSYLAAYYTASANISAILFPYLDSILQDSNSSLASNMAFSLYADLTGAPVQVTSPFFNGLNCIDWIEEVWRNNTNNGTTITLVTPPNSTVQYATNTTVKGVDLPMLEWLAAAKTLRPKYDAVWANVTKAVNQSLQDLATLSRWMTPTDKAVLTPGFTDTVHVTSQDMAYFKPG